MVQVTLNSTESTVLRQALNLVIDHDDNRGCFNDEEVQLLQDLLIKVAPKVQEAQ